MSGSLFVSAHYAICRDQAAVEVGKRGKIEKN